MSDEEEKNKITVLLYETLDADFYPSLVIR